MDYIRKTPPRRENIKWDVNIFDHHGIKYVDLKSGGLSFFNYRNPGLGSLWWKLPKGTQITSRLTRTL